VKKHTFFKKNENFCQKICVFFFLPLQRKSCARRFLRIFVALAIALVRIFHNSGCTLKNAQLFFSQYLQVRNNFCTFARLFIFAHARAWTHTYHPSEKGHPTIGLPGHAFRSRSLQRD
jgi:hypothetical protein